MPIASPAACGLAPTPVPTRRNTRQAPQRGAPSRARGFGAGAASRLRPAGRGRVARRPCLVSGNQAIAGASGGRLARPMVAGPAAPGIGAWAPGTPAPRAEPATLEPATLEPATGLDPIGAKKFAPFSGTGVFAGAVRASFVWSRVAVRRKTSRRGCGMIACSSEATSWSDRRQRPGRVRRLWPSGESPQAHRCAARAKGSSAGEPRRTAWRRLRGALAALSARPGFSAV